MPYPVMQQNEPIVVDATIAASGSLSGAVHLPNGHALVGILMPAAWDTAALTFQVSLDGTTFQNAYVAAGTEVSVTAAAATTIALDPATWLHARYLKVRSGTAASAVNQTAARTVGLILRPI